MSIPLICDNCKRVYPKRELGYLLIPDFAREDDEQLRTHLCSLKCLFEWSKTQFEFDEKIRLRNKNRRESRSKTTQKS